MTADVLSDEEFLIFSLRHYENPQCQSFEEFYEDLDRIKYLKRLMNRSDGDLSQRNRLILNHLIIVTNVFGIVPGNRILFHRMDEKYHVCLKTFLHFLNLLRTDIPEANTNAIAIDESLLNELRRL